MSRRQGSQSSHRSLHQSQGQNHESPCREDMSRRQGSQPSHRSLHQGQKQKIIYFVLFYCDKIETKRNLFDFASYNQNQSNQNQNQSNQNQSNQNEFPSKQNRTCTTGILQEQNLCSSWVHPAESKTDCCRRRRRSVPEIPPVGTTN